jgi:hypothetical protein
MSVLGEGRVVRHLAIEPEPTKPAVREVQVNLFAQPPFGLNAVAVTDQQHPDPTPPQFAGLDLSRFFEPSFQVATAAKRRPFHCLSRGICWDLVYPAMVSLRITSLIRRNAQSLWFAAVPTPRHLVAG